MDIWPSTIEVCPAERCYARIEETVEPQEFQRAASGFECEYIFLAPYTRQEWRLVEMASREFMDNLVSILKSPVLNIDVKNKIFRLVHNWTIAFEGKPSLSYAGQVYRTI